jgi:hypothetical protein
VSTYYLENWKGELEPVDPHVFDQAMKRPRPAWFVVCECGGFLPFGGYAADGLLMIERRDQAAVAGRSSGRTAASASSADRALASSSWLIPSAAVLT